MADARKLGFAAFARPAKGVLVVFCDEGLKFGPATRKALGADRRSGAAGGGGRPLHRQERQRARHRRAGRPDGARLVVVGVGKAEAQGAGFRQARRRRDGQGSGSAASEATIVAELAGGALKPDQAAELALGAQLRAYRFDRYKTKRKEGEERAGRGASVTIAVADVAAAQQGVGRARRRWRAAW